MLISMSIITCSIIDIVTNNVPQELNKKKLSYTQIAIGVVRTIFIVQYALVENATFCIFLVSMASLVIELSEFNSQLNQEFTLNRPSEIKDGKTISAPQVLTYFKSYTHLTEKVGRVDRIFNLYIFAMIACTLPTAIFAPVNLIHSQLDIHLLFNIHGVVCSIYRLCGLCLLPAQVFTQLKSTHSILNLQIPIWNDENKDIARTITNFANSIAQSSAGITVGGMALITKSMILTCLSMIMTYILLCLQLRIGSQNGNQK
ncbi:7tm chemosensory receptor domain-containing protein [Ditylenchus destructor]|nr:7tm chemosensory receptor domain-containing protein [Ditylenchus destructor]